MSELAQKSRNAMKAKIARLIDPTPGKVDASDYGPEETDMHADRKTGARPRNPRAYKRGGAVAEGDKPKPNAGKVQRKGRADGGVTEYAKKNAGRMAAEAMREREFSAKTGTRGRGAEMEARRAAVAAQKLARQPRKSGGRTAHPDAAEDRALVKSMVKPECRTKRASGGANWIAEATKHKGALHKALGVPEGEKIPAKKMAKAEHSNNPHMRKMANLAKTLKGMHDSDGGRVERARGGNVGGYHVVDEWGTVRHRAKTERGAKAGLERIAARGQERPGSPPLRAVRISNPEKYNANQHPEMMTEDTRKAYGFHPDQYGPRAKRASGGRTKGKTNVNVIIATGPQQPQGGMQPPIGAAPMGPPPMPAPNAAIPGTSPMPGGPAPAGMPPMARKRGGRTGAGEHTATKMGKYPIETGSGGGRARLDKKDAY